MRGMFRENASHKSENVTNSWLIFYWSTFFGTRQKLHEKCEKGDCPVAGELTSDQSRGKEADGFVIHVKDPTGSPSVESVPWIFRQTRENPIYTSVLKDAKFMSKFNLLKSYPFNSDFPDIF
ncbi:hypothetical protein OS493_001151 [Desmophyllum pertusum]|uniref:Fucosyltransferase N-terminal domain-containing protein n=1 Tax=Desmophyllum pertusum TaxID=174260 RepID=A0A9X0D578_9CNID|nr:hypothetical protein OS493_001151 [Desmophyllum pertusum]